jgi:thiamine biosynthesis lipoprotein
MGTTYTVRLAEALSAPGQEAWQEKIQACLDEVDARMSTYKPDSEVSRFNRSQSDGWFSVSHDTAFVVAAALDISQLTEGAFDITVGPLVNIWNFGPDQRPLEVPSDAEIAVARAAVGYRNVEVRLEPPALRKRIPQVYIDLSAIAKGFAVDQVSELLQQGGVRAYMAEIGGEVRTRGVRPDGEAWRIGIERPVAGRRDLELVVNLKDVSLATSGDYRNFFEADGRLYCHEIDPHTGRPVSNGVASVSVMDTSTMRADAFATGLMVMQPDTAWRLAGELGLEIMMFVRHEQEFEERATAGFAATIAERVN